MEEDEFSPKDLLGLSPEPTSKSVRDAFTVFGFAVRHFVKVPGRDGYELHIRRTSGKAFQDDEQARQRVGEILSCAGLSVASDTLASCRTRDQLHIGFWAALAAGVHFQGRVNQASTGSTGSPKLSESAARWLRAR